MSWLCGWADRQTETQHPPPFGTRIITRGIADKYNGEALPGLAQIFPILTEQYLYPDVEGMYNCILYEH